MGPRCQGLYGAPDRCRVRIDSLPDPVVFESAQRIGRRFGSTSEARLTRHLVTTDLLETYADANIGFADATIVAIAERLGATRLFTLDHRDFGIIRPRHVEAFEILS